MNEPKLEPDIIEATLNKLFGWDKGLSGSFSAEVVSPIIYEVANLEKLIKTSSINIFAHRTKESRAVLKTLLAKNVANRRNFLEDLAGEYPQIDIQNKVYFQKELGGIQTSYNTVIALISKGLSDRDEELETSGDEDILINEDSFVGIIVDYIWFFEQILDLNEA